MKQTIFLFSGLSLALMLLFKLSKYSILYQQINIEIYILIFGILFILLGIGIGQLVKKKEYPIDVRVTSSPPPSEQPIIDQSELEKTGLSKREYEILLLIAEGRSNNEIAQELFIAESTVKTHVSKILSKLNAKRRTQAVQIGRTLNII